MKTFAIAVLALAAGAMAHGGDEGDHGHPPPPPPGGPSGYPGGPGGYPGGPGGPPDCTTSGEHQHTTKSWTDKPTKWSTSTIFTVSTTTTDCGEGPTATVITVPSFTLYPITESETISTTTKTSSVAVTLTTEVPSSTYGGYPTYSQSSAAPVETYPVEISSTAAYTVIPYPVSSASSTAGWTTSTAGGYPTTEISSVGTTSTKTTSKNSPTSTSTQTPVTAAAAANIQGAGAAIVAAAFAIALI